MNDTPKNDPAKAGMYAGKKRLFGPHNRYAIAPVHTRFDAVEWLVWDAYERDDLTGLAAVVRQAPTEAEALAGLED